MGNNNSEGQAAAIGLGIFGIAAIAVLTVFSVVGAVLAVVFLAVTVSAKKEAYGWSGCVSREDFGALFIGFLLVSLAVIPLLEAWLPARNIERNGYYILTWMKMGMVICVWLAPYVCVNQGFTGRWWEHKSKELDADEASVAARENAMWRKKYGQPEASALLPNFTAPASDNTRDPHAPGQAGRMFQVPRQRRGL